MKSESPISIIAGLSSQLEVQLQDCKKALTKASQEIESLQKQLHDTTANDAQRYNELSSQLETQKAEYEKQATELTRLLSLQEQLELSRQQAETERDVWRTIGIAAVVAAIVEGLILVFGGGK